MKNVDLNPGGLIGALVFGGIAVAVLISSLGTEDEGGRSARLVIAAVIGGAFAGNFLWGLIANKSNKN